MHLSPRADRQILPTALDDALLRSWPLPLDEHGDKRTRGTVLVSAGSATTAGAALLAGTAALRMGAGRLQIATAAPVATGLSIAMPEAMVLPLPDADDTQFSRHLASTLSQHICGAQAVLVGPGLAGSEAIRAILELITEQLAADAILVIDAAALDAVSALDHGARKRIARRLLLTPNRDEMQKLINSLGLGHGNDPAMAAARELGAVITCFADVTSHDDRRWQAKPSTPGLGTSGSGDVLAGLAAGAAARCGDPAQAACWATFVHGAAGNQLSERFGTTSFIARELLDEVPRILATFD